MKTIKKKAEYPSHRDILTYTVFRSVPHTDILTYTQCLGVSLTQRYIDLHTVFRSVPHTEIY